MQVQGGLGHPQQQQLKEAVVHLHPAGVQFHQAPQGGGVAHRAEDELAVQHLAVGLDVGGVGPQAVQIVEALQNIGEMAQGVFRLLGRVVGRLGKGAEGGHVGEISVVEAADVQVEAPAAGDGSRRHGGVAAEPQTGGEVVGAAKGQVADGGPVFQAHQPGDGLVQRAVASGAYDQIIVAPRLRHGLPGVAPGGGHKDPHQVARLAEPGHRVKKRRHGLGFTGFGVHDKQ